MLALSITAFDPQGTFKQLAHHLECKKNHAKTTKK
jgi:hypothetical protein